MAICTRQAGYALSIRTSFIFTTAAFPAPARYMGSHMYAGGSIGIATLRRDGFASIEGSGMLLTRKLRFDGHTLYVNADASRGSLSAELLSADGRVLLSREDCCPVQEDTVKTAVHWRGSEPLERFQEEKVRIRFYLENAWLYSFWISLKPSGASMGYLAAGGPGLLDGADRG